MDARTFLAGVVVAAALPLAISAQQAMPQMKSCEPGIAKIGDVVTVTGENLDKANVEKVYLTDGKDDFVVDVQDQTATAIKLKVPAKVKLGRYALMLLTRGKEPKLIEQPVKLTVSDQTPPPPPAAEQPAPAQPAQPAQPAPAQPKPQQ